MRVDYAMNQSFSLDMKLFFGTIAGVFKKNKKIIAGK